MGELPALTWGDIDLEKKTISINKTASNIKNRDTDKKTEYKIEITEPKSKCGKRAIPISRKAEKILQKQKKLQYIHYDTFAMRLVEKGANIKVISELLGHSSIQVTLDIYGHVLPNQKAEAINLLD